MDPKAHLWHTDNPTHRLLSSGQDRVGNLVAGTETGPREMVHERRLACQPEVWAAQTALCDVHGSLTLSVLMSRL